MCWVLVAHTYNPCYSGGSNQEERGSKPAPSKSSCDPNSKKTLHKNRASGVAQSKGSLFKAQYHKINT
jgi:hypothetical protein